MLHRRLLVVLGTLTLALASCTVDDGTGPTGDGGGSGGTLRIEPADRTEAITGTPVQIDYRVFRGSEDVTAGASWTLSNPSLGAFTGAHFTSNTTFGGTTQVRASAGSDTGSTTLTLTLERNIVEVGAPPNAPELFAGGTPDATRAPELVYPDDQTVIPPNLSELEFHFRPNGFDTFELHFAAGAVTLRIYFNCRPLEGGCEYVPPGPTWDAISAAARGAGPITYTLRGIDAAGKIGAAAARTIEVVEEDIVGGVYYWNSRGTIDRFEFGVPGASAEKFIDSTRTQIPGCIGCHAISRDGTRIAVGIGIPTTDMQAFDVATRNRLWQTPTPGAPPPPIVPSQPNFTAWSSDGSLLVGSSNKGLFLRDGNTGAEVGGPLGGGAASMPDFSPDGSHIAFVTRMYVEVPIFPLYDLSSVAAGSIAVLDRVGGAWGEARTIVTGSGNNYYPAYSPDGNWIAFVRSPAGTGSMGIDPETMPWVPDAELWLVDANGTMPPRRLDRTDGFADAWPKWDPTKYESRGAPIFWMTWSSRRAFGLRWEEGGDPQLWMAAFRPNDATGGLDPAYPAFRLPFQDATTGNHIGQWVTSVQRQTCVDDSQCGGEFCYDGRCFETEPAM